VPDPELVADWVVEKADRLVRAGDVHAALDLIDESVLIDKVGLGWEETAQARVSGRDSATADRAESRPHTHPRKQLNTPGSSMAARAGPRLIAELEVGGSPASTREGALAFLRLKVMNK
jgi:hypothetical protein